MGVLSQCLTFNRLTTSWNIGWSRGFKARFLSVYLADSLHRPNASDRSHCCQVEKSKMHFSKYFIFRLWSQRHHSWMWSRFFSAVMTSPLDSGHITRPHYIVSHRHQNMSDPWVRCLCCSAQSLKILHLNVSHHSPDMMIQCGFIWQL